MYCKYTQNLKTAKKEEVGKNVSTYLVTSQMFKHKA